MEPRRLLAILRRRAPALIAVALVGALVGYLTAFHTPTYRAQALLYVGKPITTATTPDDAFAAEALAVSLAPAVGSLPVAQAALAESHLPGSAAKVAAATSAAAYPGSNVLLVEVADPNPMRSEQLTNAVAAAFPRLAATLPSVLAAAGVSPSSSTSTTGVPGAAAPAPAPAPATGKAQLVSVYRTALLPTAAPGPSTGRYVGLGALIGLLVGLALVALVDLTGLAARTPARLEADLGLPVLGALPFQRRLAVQAPPASPADRAPDPSPPDDA